MAKAWCLLVAVLAASQTLAQEYSYDGNRWYEVEVSVFTNEVPGGAYSEIAVPGKVTAAYLPRVRELQTRASAFAIAFPQDLLPAQPALQAEPALPQAGVLVPGAEPLPPAVRMGPVYSPAVRDSFKITDFDRDPFIDLDTRAARFGTINRSIGSSPEHRLLWHKVWRQPMQGRAQIPAVFVSGGEVRGRHTELEGSLRLSDNAGGVMLDINIWLNHFASGSAEEVSEWQIPELPFALPEPPALLPATAQQAETWQLAEVWQLAQTRELGANELYYLDHPAVGVLIQIRPYLLPQRLVAEDQADF